MRHSRTNLRITRGQVASSDCSLDPIRERLKSALKGESCRAIGLRTDTHPETVRRYLSNGHPSIEFLSAVIHAYDISCNWLIMGIGPQRQSEVADYSIRSATLSRLLRGIAEKLATSEEVGRLAAHGSSAQLRMTSSLAPEISSRIRNSLSAAHQSTST
ncbi:MAG: hypothetical protein KF805_11720 [Phycisphaeraceae bacterium]|nr:hypothetical protein [Phycisphaeraceae bacterium]